MQNLIRQGKKSGKNHSRGEFSHAKITLQTKGASKKKKVPGWVTGDKTITNESINQLLEIPESQLSRQILYQASEKLLSSVQASEIKKSQNQYALLEQKAAQKEISDKNKSIQSQVDDMIAINDNDRETIIQQTKQLDSLRSKAKQLANAHANLKPGEQVSFISKISSPLKLRSLW